PIAKGSEHAEALILFKDSEHTTKNVKCEYNMNKDVFPISLICKRLMYNMILLRHHNSVSLQLEEREMEKALQNPFGANSEVGHSTNSKTKGTIVHDCGNGRSYVDTRGFDDSDEKKDDAEIAREILRKIVDNHIKKLTTILWFVLPDNRATHSLKLQAGFIESLVMLLKI
ncbi:9277_t:CDS:2, partial [Dentiscutata erythropus]